MGANQRVYVIDPENFLKKGGVMKRGLEGKEDVPEGAGRLSRGRSRRASLEPVEEKGSPALAFLAYLFGPYSIFATRHGRLSAVWTILTVISGLTTAVIVARWTSIFSGPHGAGLGYLIWMGAAVLALGLGCASWVRGAMLLHRHRGWLVGKLPGALRHPAAAGFFGLVVPGLGLFATGHAKRAALALLAAGSTVVAALVLWQAPPLWRLSQAYGVLAGRGDTLERLFIVMGAIGVFGAIAWIVQALDGARLAGNAVAGVSPHRSDWAAAALIMAIMALLAAFKPARVAETTDRFAVAMKDEGLRIIPLYASYAEMKLDPSMPGYAVQAIELNEALGRTYHAEVIRSYLAERWKPYERMLRLEGAMAGPAAYGPEKP